MPNDPYGSRQPGGQQETETKASWKTTELLFYVLTFVLILIASNTISVEDGQTDWFRADQAWLYITILTAAYMLSRGIAKSGSRDPYTTGSSGNGVGITDRLEAAVGALKDPSGHETHGSGSGNGEPSTVGSSGRSHRDGERY